MYDFRRIYNDLASTDSDLKQFQQHANALSQIQLAAAQAQLQQQQQQQPALETTPSSQPMDTQQILQQTVSSKNFVNFNLHQYASIQLQLQSMLLNAGINPAQAIALSQNSLGNDTTIVFYVYGYYYIMYMCRTVTSPCSPAVG